MRGSARPRRAVAARAAPRKESGRNELPRLKGLVDGLKSDIRALRRPADQVQSAIVRVRKPLKLPGQIKGKAKRVKTVAQGLDSIAQIASLIPGPIGTGGSATHRALKPLVGRGGVLESVITSLDKLDKAVKPLVTKLNQIERPVNKARDSLNDLLVQVGRLETVHSLVRERYGATPPAEVQACLARLNDAVEKVAKPLNGARTKAAARLQEIADALRKLEAALKPLTAIARDVRAALDKIDNAAVRKISGALKKIADIVKPVRVAIDFVIGKALKLLRIDLKAIDRFFKRIVGALNPFKGLQKKLDKLAADLTARIKALPGIAAIAGSLERLRDLEKQLDREVSKLLRGACGKVLMPEG